MAAYTIWIDMEDIFQYAAHNRRPSGIQRQVYEILQVLQGCISRPEDVRIGYVRKGADGDPACIVSAQDVENLFASLADDEIASVSGLSRKTPSSKQARRKNFSLQSVNAKAVAFRQFNSLRHALIRKFEQMPEPVGRPLLRAGTLQMRVLRMIRDLRNQSAVRHSASGENVPVRIPQSGRGSSAPLPRPHGMKPDDIFLVMGAAWADAAFGERLRAVRKSYGMKPVLLIYDLIPLTCPEWFPPQVVSTFSAWLENVIPQCSDIMVISHATKKDVQDFLVQRSLHLNQAPWVVPMGGGFGDMSVATSGPDAPGLPPAKSYVLFVSTLEARKNHILMFQVWARLLREKAYTDVPTLVFAGRPASMVEDLMQQMENTDYLDGKVRLIREPSDEELRCLYKNCLFTVFPSLYEGWGLPVTESLLFGRPCVASNVTSIPEAGGDFARYFDPYDFETVYDTICRTIEDREGLKAWEDQIRKNFRPTPWSDTAKAILQSCEVAHQSSQPTLRRAG